MRRTLLFILFVAGCSESAHRPPGPEIALEASFGGRTPWSANGTLKIGPDGVGHFTKYRPDGAGDRREEDFTVDEAGRAAILRAVRENGFLDLKPKYDSGASDGSYCHIEVTAGSRTHAVTCANYALPAFDNVARAANAVLPPSCRIFYNEIAR